MVWPIVALGIVISTIFSKFVLNDLNNGSVRESAKKDLIDLAVMAVYCADVDSVAALGEQPLRLTSNHVQKLRTV